MKYCLLTLFFLSLGIQISAQVIYVNTLDDRLYRLDINSCSYEYVTTVNSEVFDISFHPNGNLYGIAGNGRFFQIDTIAGFTSLVHKFNGQYYNSLTASADGLIYTTGSHRELWSYDIANGTARFHGDTGLKATGDLTFYQGKLYAAVTGNRIAHIDIENPENSSIVIDQSVPGDIFGIVSFAEDCSEVNSYAITDGNSDIYQIDFTTNSLNFICEMNIEIGGGASTFEFLASAPIEIEELDIVTPLCNFNNGSIMVQASGGTGGITYSIDGLNFTDNGEFESLGDGLYTLYIRDNIGCIITEEVELPALNSPQISDVLIQDLTCDEVNGAIVVSADGGTGILEYSIDGINFQLDNAFNELQDGLFEIVIRDSIGCTDRAEVTLVAIGSPKMNLMQVTHTTCNQSDGSFEVEVSGGALPYEYTIDDVNFQDSDLFENLSAGSYQAIVRDDNGCEDSLELVIEESEPPLSLPVMTIASQCGTDNGSIVVEAIEGDGTTQYSINGSEYQQDNQFVNVASGNYTVYIKDKKNCISTENVEVASSEAFTISNIESTLEDCGEANGSFLIEIDGGTEPISATVNDDYFESQLFFENLSSGIYVLNLEDAEGCRVDTLISVGAKECPIYVPNTISPNDDGINDEFSIVTHQAFEGEFKSFKVFDRWGNLIYDISNFSIDELTWDGTLNGKALADGVYIYHLEYVPGGNEAVIRTGDITILK